MKKLILSMFVIGSFGFYVISQNGGNSSNDFTMPAPVVAVNNISKKNSKSSATVSNSSVLNNSKTPVISPPAPTPVISSSPKTSLYNDGTYVGNVADAYYGNIQVKAVITNGKLSDVIFLDYPQDRRTSLQINRQAIPILKSEAIKSQSANVNTVSGATDSSGAFRNSLASALSQAKI